MFNKQIKTTFLKNCDPFDQGYDKALDGGRMRGKFIMFYEFTRRTPSYYALAFDLYSKHLFYL